MDRAGLKYQRQGNCFPWIKDWDKAQRLMNRQVEANWRSCSAQSRSS
jgi:hypothetical protein